MTTRKIITEVFHDTHEYLDPAWTPGDTYQAREIEVEGPDPMSGGWREVREIRRAWGRTGEAARAKLEPSA